MQVRNTEAALNIEKKNRRGYFKTIITVNFFLSIELLFFDSIEI